MMNDLRDSIFESPVTVDGRPGYKVTMMGWDKNGVNRIDIENVGDDPFTKQITREENQRLVREMEDLKIQLVNITDHNKRCRVALVKALLLEGKEGDNPDQYPLQWLISAAADVLTRQRDELKKDKDKYVVLGIQNQSDRLQEATKGEKGVFLGVAVTRAIRTIEELMKDNARLYCEHTLSHTTSHNLKP